MESDDMTMLQHLLIALAAGWLIGFELSYHGQPAGFRIFRISSQYSKYA